MADQLRWDYLSCYGHPHLKTPNIDSLAKLNTFSYPCGKVLKSKLLSHYFSYIDPRYDFEFQQITKDIELACLYAGINTPFDVRGSLLLAQKLMEKKVLKKFTKMQFKN